MDAVNSSTTSDYSDYRSIVCLDGKRFYVFNKIFGKVGTENTCKCYNNTINYPLVGTSVLIKDEKNSLLVPSVNVSVALIKTSSSI